MRRKTFDALLTSAGLVLAVFLLVAGGLLTWASTFIGGQVHDQLAAQKIFFPAAASAQLPASEYPDLQQYGGKQVLTGEQAKAFSTYIASHLKATGGGKSYSELSALSRANPDDAKAKATVDTVFRGETLRGLLLYGYAFGTMGVIAGYAAIAAFAGAAVLLLLSVLGFLHLRRTPPDAVIGAPATPELITT